MRTTFIWIGLIVGSVVGSFAPLLWGSSAFSLWGIVTSGVGALVGIWVGFKISKM